MSLARKLMVGIELGVFALSVAISFGAGTWVPAAIGAPVLALGVYDLCRQ